jgi:hypothetical protein
VKSGGDCDQAGEIVDSDVTVEASVSLSRQQRGSGKVSRGDGSAASKRPLNEHDAFSNSFLAEALLREAGAKGGLDSTFEQAGGGASLDEDFWVFAEDGDERKQQKDALPGLRPKHEGSEYEDFANGVAFVQGSGDDHAVDPNDVKQGALGDCYLIAGMAAVARADPRAIQDAIKDNGDGTFDVTLFLRATRSSRPRAVTRTVDARLAVKSAGRPLYAGTGDTDGDQVELWTALIEKTVAQHKESYDLISGGNINGDGFVFAGVSELLTGKAESYMSTDRMDGDEALLYMSFALEEKKPLVASSKNIEGDEELTREANRYNVYWNHAYAPESVDLGARTVNLQNPWGSSHVRDLPIDKFLQYYKALRIGGAR